MKRGWIQTWKNLLFQHFELENTTALEKYLPKDCTFDSFDGKFYIGLVSMEMTEVKHKSMPSLVLFKKYNELNVRTYIRHNNKPGVLFLSLDVDSLISVLGARIFYGLPYRYATYTNASESIHSKRSSKTQFRAHYKVISKAQSSKKDSFAHFATERYFFASKYLGISFKGEITHKPWKLASAKVENINLGVLEPYNLYKQHPTILFCEQLDVQTGTLKRI